MAAGLIRFGIAGPQQWPAPEQDDPADPIVSEIGHTGRLWTPQDTRLVGLVSCAVAVLLALLAALRFGPPWPGPCWFALSVSALLLAAGVTLARTIGDAGAGAALAALALPHAFAGGMLLPAGTLPLSGFHAPQLLTGCAAMLVVSVLGNLGVAAWPALFACGATAGLLGALAAWLALMELDDASVAAVLGCLVLIVCPLFGPLSQWFGRIPRSGYPAVVRADGLLTGMVAGGSLVAVLCEIVLAGDGSAAAVVLLFVLCPGFCLRARLYPAVRQRVPMLGTGLAGAACLVAGPLMSGSLVVAAPVLLALAAAAALLGLRYGRKQPNVYFGRLAEALEVLLVLACVPVACWVLGLYNLVRGLGS